MKTVITPTGLLLTYNFQAEDFEFSTITYLLFAGLRNVDLSLLDIESIPLLL